MKIKFPEKPNVEHDDEDPLDAYNRRRGGGDAEIKRLMGVRDFPPLTPERKQQHFKSPERIAALDGVSTATTDGRGWMRAMKKAIPAALLEQGLLREDLLKTLPTVYLGSLDSVEWPLAMGARHIELVDPAFQDEKVRESVAQKIRRLTGEAMPEHAQEFSFQFDFGRGKEAVTVKMVPQAYPLNGWGDYVLPEHVACILLFASGGPGGYLRPTDEMKSHVVPGGLIVDAAKVWQAGEKGEPGKEFELGE